MNPTEAVPSIEWDVVIDQLRAQTRIGIYGHERVSQPVVIDAVLHCRSQALPEHIEDCLDYDAFCRMLCAYLDEQPHTDLLERLAAEGTPAEVLVKRGSAPPADRPARAGLRTLRWKTV